MRKLLIVVLVAAVGWFANQRHREKVRAAEQQRTAAEYGDFEPERSGSSATAPRAEPAQVEYSTPPTAFRCDGRQHCSQMTSCEEAKWMVDNCTGMKMDCDHDGRPCEERCGH